jgi:hypothetical protein
MHFVFCSLGLGCKQMLPFLRKACCRHVPHEAMCIGCCEAMCILYPAMRFLTRAVSDCRGASPSHALDERNLHHLDMAAKACK